MTDIKAKADTGTTDTAAETPTARARAWFNAAVLSLIAFWVLLFVTGPSEKLIASNLIPFGIVSGAFIVLSVYVSQGLARGKRLGGAAWILSFLAFSMVMGFAYSFTGVQHYPEWSIRALLLLVLLVALRALWAVIVAYRDSSGGGTAP